MMIYPPTVFVKLKAKFSKLPQCYTFSPVLTVINVFSFFEISTPAGGRAQVRHLHLSQEGGGPEQDHHSYHRDLSQEGRGSEQDHPSSQFVCQPDQVETLAACSN